MNISEIKDHWRKDCKIDIENLANEAAKTPEFHSKYYDLYVDEKIELKKIESEYKVLKRLKYEYYLGKLSPEQIKNLGWEQFDLKILRSELDVYIDSDSDLIRCTLRISEQQEKVLFLENIIKAINGRGFHIKSAIDFIRWTQGS